MRRGVFLLPVLTLVLLLTACGANHQDYVGRNKALLESLPVFPGAVKIHEVSTPYVHSEADLSDPSGYQTNAVYRVQAGRRGAVLRFYESRLRRRGWHVRRFGGNRWPIATFTRGGALVAVDTILPTYEVTVDYRGAGRG